MTEKAFYKSPLAGELGREQMLKDVKTRAEHKKPVTAWVRTAAAVFCVVLVGSIGLMLANGGSLSNDSAKCETATAADMNRTVRAQDYIAEAAFESDGQYTDACDEASELHEKQLQTLSKYAKIIAAVTPSGENEVTVIKGFRGAQAGQVLKTAYCGLPEGQEYLLFLIKSIRGYIPLLAGADGVYCVDIEGGAYWLRDTPENRRPIAEIEALG